MTKKIAWERHPVSPERKAELVAQGYKILDIRFRPASAVEPAPVVAAAPAVEPEAPVDAPVEAAIAAPVYTPSKPRGRPRKGR